MIKLFPEKCLFCNSKLKYFDIKHYNSLLCIKCIRYHIYIDNNNNIVEDFIHEKLSITNLLYSRNGQELSINEYDSNESALISGLFNDEKYYIEKHSFGKLDCNKYLNDIGCKQLLVLRNFYISPKTNIGLIKSLL